MFVKNPHLTEQQASQELELLRGVRWQYSDTAYQQEVQKINEATIHFPKRTYAVPICIGGRIFS